MIPIRVNRPLKISIITAVYNAQNTVAQAIQSVADQSYPNIQHIVIDGKSSDNSLRSIKSVAHSSMELISEPDNGIYHALNKGIARATGEVIGFLHSDDFFPHRDVLSKIANAFESPGVEAVYSDLDYVSQSDEKQVVRHWQSGDFAKHRLKWGWMPPHPTLYLKRSVYEGIGMFDTTYRNSADYDFVLRFFSQTDVKAVYIPEVLYKMRLGGESNRDLVRILRKSREDYRAIKSNQIGGLAALLAKNVSKLGQFVRR